VTEAVQGKRF